MTIYTIEFNIERGDYWALIQRILEQLGRLTGRCSHQRPILPPQYEGSAPPQDWLDLVLSTDHRTVTIRLRCDNVYLVGYRTEQGTWFEFGSNNDARSRRLIPGSTFLGYDGSYGALASHGGDVDSMRVTRQGVLNAVNDLARPNTRDTNPRAPSLCVLIVVLCEATRFDFLLPRLTGPIRDPQRYPPAEIDASTRAFLNGWGVLSRMLREDDAIGGYRFEFPRDSPFTNIIRNGFQAAGYVGLVLGPIIPSDPRVGLSAYSNVHKGIVEEGEPLMEVFSFKFVGFSGCFRGKITVEDGLSTQVLLDVDDKEWVRKGDCLSLNGLKRAISACQSVKLYYRLSSADRSTNMYIAVSREWNFFKNMSFDADASPTAGSVSMGGEIVVDYQIFPSAWQVRWKARVIEDDSYEKQNIYGHIRVSYKFRGKYHQISLFERASDHNVEVKIREPIPLLKTLTAMPLDVDVAVEAELYDHMSLFFVPDRQLMKGKVFHRFGSREFGKAESGEAAFLQNGRVQILANWNRLSTE